VLTQGTQSKHIGDVLAENMIMSIVLLLSIGLYMVYNATSDGDSSVSFMFIKHFTFGILGLICFFSVLNLLDLNRLKRWAPIIGAVVVVALIAVLFVGPEIKGARRWFRISLHSTLQLSIQPSEMAKIMSLIYFAWYLDAKKDCMNQWYGLLPCITMMLIVVGLLAAEPDFGNASLLFFVLISMLYIAGARLFHLLILLSITLPIFALGMISRFDHILKRLDVWLNPQDHVLGGGYQVHQALIALGSGGIAGKGVGEGLQKLHFLPEAHNDFIFAIIGEDFGFLGCAFVIFLYAILVWYAIQVCVRCTKLFSLLLSYGITFVFAGQALFNTCVVTGIVPNKGINLPLVSFGGSNTIFTLIGLAILVKIAQSLPPDRPLAIGAIPNPKAKALF
jgi:cell division protein FtsW